MKNSRAKLVAVEYSVPSATDVSGVDGGLLTADEGGQRGDGDDGWSWRMDLGPDGAHPWMNLEMESSSLVALP